MKKLLSILGAVGLVSTSASVVVSCGDDSAEIKDLNVDSDTSIINVEKDIARQLYGKDLEIVADDEHPSMIAYELGDDEAGFILMFNSKLGADQFIDLAGGSKPSNPSDDIVPIGLDYVSGDPIPVLNLEHEGYTYVAGEASMTNASDYSKWNFKYEGLITFGNE